MPHEIKIPPLGESITTATIAALLKPSSTLVRENEEIAELETEKVAQILYAPCSGTLKWHVKVGETVAIGRVIGIVEEEGAQEPVLKVKVEQQSPPSFQEASIQKEEKHDEESQARESRQRMSALRASLAERLVHSLHTTASLTTFNEVDMSAIQDWRKKYKEEFFQKQGVRLGLMPFFIKALVEGLKQFPALNAYIEGQEIVYRHYYDIGVAISSTHGLVVPVVRACERLSFAGIEKEIQRYSQKANAGKLAIEDLRGGGFTLTNGGVFGSLLSTPLLNPPQVGILGMHQIKERPMAYEGSILIRPMMYVALSYDHRLIDGKEAISFLVLIKELLESPARLLLDD